MITSVATDELLSFQNLYVILLSYRDQIIVARKEHHNMEHGSMVLLCAKDDKYQSLYLKYLILYQLSTTNKSFTSACCPGFKRFPHSSQRKHSGCQSYPKDCLRSAADKQV